MGDTSIPTRAGTRIGTADTYPLPLAAWLSPAFPVGAFAYSQGLEAAVEREDIRDAASALAWLEDLVVFGAMRTDAILLAAAWRADDPLPINALALALAPSAERRLETASGGTAFLKAIAAAWPAPMIADLVARLRDEDIAYPVAVGVTAVSHGIALRPTLGAFALAALGNLVSALLRLGPIGQTEAQTMIARLCPALDRLADDAAASNLDDLGAATWRADIASMRHETQYSRLFRS